LLYRISLVDTLMKHPRYRRGKQESNDVDIIFTHPEGKGMEEAAADLGTKLVLRLRLLGTIQV
jgi:hypothetical protein